MIHRIRRVLCCAVVVLAIGVSLGLPVAAQVLKREGVWAQSYVDRPADPDVRFGQLDNGMRYAVRRNATPVGATSMRLWIGAGSLAERDDQQGLAHFLEHMAFRGSKNVPAGDLVRILQRLGLSFGADTNASTGLDATIYKFDLPKTDAESLATGLMLLREIAGELTLAQSEMDPERGVVLSEERVRDGPSYRQNVAELGFQLQGQLAASRMPIGKTEILRNAPVSLIRDFYEAHYRPDNAALIAVGDFDVDAMEATIRARFADWAPKPAPPAADLGRVAQRGPTMRMFSLPGLAPSFSISWVSPYDAAADTAATTRRDLAEAIVLGVLNRRLERLAQGAGTGEAPFLGARAGQGNIAKSARLTELSGQPKPGAWQAALTAAITEQRRLLEHGVLPAERDRVTTELLTDMRVAAEGAATRASARLADGIVRAVSSNEVFSSPAQDLAESLAVLPSLTAAEIAAAARRLFTGNGPLVFLGGPVPVDESAVAAIVAAAVAAPVAAATVQAEAAWPYAAAAIPGTPAERSRVEDLGLTQVRFANNVRLTVKQTDFARDEIQVRIRVGTGRLGIPPELARASWLMSTPLLRLGGTQELTWEEIEALTAGNRLGVGLSLDDDAFLLTGTTRLADLDRQMQLLQAYVTRPGLRPAAFDRLKAGLLNRLAQSEATASSVFSRAAGPALHGGDLRWQRSPDGPALAAATAADLPALIGRDFAEGPVEVTIVGDIAPDQAIAAVAASFGALPPRAIRQPADVSAPLFAPATIFVPHAGRADQAMAMAAWPTDDFFADPQAQRVLGVAAAILRTRLTDRLRSAEGVTYSPTVESDSSRVFKGFGYIAAIVETPLDRLGAFQSALDDIVAGLQATPATPDELQRAKLPLIDRRLRALRENDYWAGTLAIAQGDARQLDGIRALVTGTEQVTAEQVMLAMRRYVVPAAAMRLVVRPAGVN